MNTLKNLVHCFRGPLTRDEKASARLLPFGEVYIRFCALGPGDHWLTLKQLLRICMLSNGHGMTDVLDRLTDMLTGTKFLLYVHALPYGKANREKTTVHVADVTTFNTEGLPVQPDIENTGSVLNRLKHEFRDRIKTRGHVDYPFTGKDTANAKRILSMAGGFEAALDFMKYYFKMPPEFRGDDLSFTAFYLTVPRIIGIRDGERIEAFEMAAGERRAAARSRIPTDAETDDFLRRANKQIAENRENQSKPRASRRRWDEEEDEL